MTSKPGNKFSKSDAEWRDRLDEEQYRVTRLGGTERAFTGKYWNEKAAGSYSCVCCGERLFSSTTKFDSGSGWPSFTAPASDEAVKTVRDDSHGMIRTEVRCASCEAHLGHLFPDGPPDAGGLRYCVNSAALELDEE